MTCASLQQGGAPTESVVPHEHPAETTPPSLLQSRSRGPVTIAVLLALIVAAFEGTVVTTAMPTIVRDLGQPELFSWVFSSFLLTSTVGVLLCGRLADTLGRKPVFLGGMGLFLLGSLLCGLAPSLGYLVAFRALQGMGAGAIQPIAMTIVSDIYDLRERAKMQGLFTGTWGASSLVGPLLGGFLAAHGSWRLVFWVNVPVGLLAALVLAVVYRDPPREKQPIALGNALLGGLSAALLLLSLEPIARHGAPTGGADVLQPTQAMQTTGPSALIALNASQGTAGRVALLALAVALGVVFVRREKTASAPLLPRTLLPDPIVRVGYLGSLAGGALLYALTAYVPLWIENERGLGAKAASLALSLLLAGWATGSTLGVGVFVRWGLRASAGGGFALASLGLVALSLLAMAGDRAPGAFFAVYPALFLIGVGLGPAVSTCLVGPQSRAPFEARGMLTSSIYATRSLGGALAVGALGALGAAQTSVAFGAAAPGTEGTFATRALLLTLSTSTVCALMLVLARPAVRSAKGQPA